MRATNVLELNTRLWLRGLGVGSLADVPETELDRLLTPGFDVLWLMGVWRPSPAGERIARATPEVVAACAAALPGATPSDVVASPYAIAEYSVSEALGGEEGLARLRERLYARGVALWLDFVPNHTALDHRFVTEDPGLYVPGDALREDEAFTSPTGLRIAHGRDPYFPPWRDTAQLDYRRARTHRAMTSELLAVARRCDGVRCDMAMLLLPEVIARTWGQRSSPTPAEGERATASFWPGAIDAVRAEHPSFTFVAEAYWGTGDRLVAEGFDYVYDKEYYDALTTARPEAITAALRAPARLDRRLRFLENHDEPRASEHFRDAPHRLAALLTFALPGARLVHDGQLEGLRVRLPVQLGAAPPHRGDPGLTAFYANARRALRDPVLGSSAPIGLSPEPAWAGNGSHKAFVALAWDGSAHPWDERGGHRLLVLNFAEHPAECRLRMSLPGLAGRPVVLSEQIATGSTPAGDRESASGGPAYVRDGDALAAEGLYVALPPLSGQLFWVGPEAVAGASLAPGRAE